MSWILLAGLLCQSAAMELANDQWTITLSTAPDGAPVLASALWRGDASEVFRAEDPASTLTQWLPAEVTNGAPPANPAEDWKRTDSGVFSRATLDREWTGRVRVTWTVEMFKPASLCRMGVSMTNLGKDPLPVAWFPAWTGAWALPGAAELRGWRPLSFERVDQDFAKGFDVQWESRVHSSDDPQHGMHPYWRIAAGKEHLYFGLEWCGGWQAALRGKDNTFNFRVFLPPDETQLVLQPGESIEGPRFHVAAVHEAGETQARAAWLRQQTALGDALYGGPKRGYPLTYNNWYTTRFKVDAAFLKRQVGNMDPFGFDYFIVDAGWYESVGQWTPDPAKFQPGEFEAILKSAEDHHARPGVWSCPQFVTAAPDKLPPEVDVPGMYREFIKGYLLDYANMDFPKFLGDHVDLLCQRYGMAWWKYDQDFFTKETRAGRMKNVAAFQKALLDVRRKHPELMIENCQSGGRMINEFSVLLTQSQWLRDGGHTGRDLARDSISIALNAMDFLFPAVCCRWSNNPDQTPPKDDELLRLLCRSSMPGTWGIVADLPRLTPHQREIIVEEIAHYRRLNPYKESHRYDLFPPKPGAPAAGVVFYLEDKREAAVLLFRWSAKGQFEYPLALPLLDANGKYRIEDVYGNENTVSGKKLTRGACKVAFPEDRQSNLLFVKPK